MSDEITVTIEKFQDHCLRLVDKVSQQHKPITITKRGKPIAKLMPYEQSPQTLYGAMKGTIHILDDLVNPIDIDWEVEPNN